MDWSSLINPTEWIKLVLKWWNKPVPVILFEPLKSGECENDYCHLRINSSFGDRPSWFYRIAVNNNGGERISEADVRLEKIEVERNGKFEQLGSSPFFLHWANENTNNSRSIYTDTPVFCDVVFTVKGIDSLFLYNKQKHTDAGIPSILPAGKYRLRLKLLGANIKPLTKNIELNFNGKWDSLKIELIL